MMKLSELLVRAAVGAGLMYLLDPHAGQPRHDPLSEAKPKAGNGHGEARQEAQHLFREVTAEVTAQGDSDPAISDRVHEAIQRRVSYASAIRVDVVDGRATLYGPVLSHDLLPVLSAARGVSGVTSVDSQLNIQHTPANLPDFQNVPARRSLAL